MQQNDGELKTLIDKILELGDVLLVSNKGMGKTNALMVLAKKFMELENTRIFIFEDFPKFAVEFDGGVKFVRVLDNDVVETRDLVDISDYYLSHAKDFTVQRGSFYNQALKDNRHLIFTMEIKDIQWKSKTSNEKPSSFTQSCNTFIERHTLDVTKATTNMNESFLFSRKVKTLLRKQP